MGRSRALITETEREVMKGERGDDDRLRNAKWEVRQRIEDELPADIGVLAKHHPDLLEELREVVCDGTN